ncbi:DeoR/GlpR family DNA-binding transcription regulator [Isoptericola halotolerans]|uniref:DeoR/GlpR family transcriptional regulator of sugar metabolism n=1 Tax=Isoptericola halotolerans TaxID=300560 RepID=A0ABX2A8H8_9MICO|nr:DeoR/GlpR family DNA-binding transcription regulator [Isoptericola halotolerans]NOV99000.1 DeoR/GlpR family transcriptional regulator of sugar metabolism [Isoptericola halotolerans]
MAPSPTPDPGNGARRLPAGRKAELAEFVAQAGEVTVAQLAERFDVSADTIRRDLDALDADGVVVRTHGGAVSTSAVPRPDTGVEVRLRLRTAAKERIGVLAASLVRDGAALLINAGSTTLSLARALSDHRELTVATNNLRIAAEMSPSVYRDLYVLGGAIRPSAQATFGPVRFAAWSDGPEIDIRCDLAFIAVGAVSVTDGFSTSNVTEASMMSDMMDRAERVVVLADSSKFGRRLFATVAELDRADVLVTDADPPADLRDALTAAGVEVKVASA